MKHLIVYPNCSKGGVSTVIRGRAVANPHAEYHCVFLHDKGGRDAFSDLPNVQVRIVNRGRIAAYLSFLSANHAYKRISILSDPDALNQSSFAGSGRVVYEFHSSNMGIVGSEISRIDFSKIDEIRVPSMYMRDRIDSLLGEYPRVPLTVEPNLVDTRSFHPGPSDSEYFEPSEKPLLWIGRFDKDKGVKNFLRALSLLPDEYVGYVFVSLESDPARASDFYGEVAAAGVQDRVHLMMNVPQARLADMYREARSQGGAMISTSLMESFGYSVAEALACNLPVHAFELPVFSEHGGVERGLFQVDIGDVMALAESISGKPLSASK